MITFSHMVEQFQRYGWRLEKIDPRAYIAYPVVRSPKDWISKVLLGLTVLLMGALLYVPGQSFDISNYRQLSSREFRSYADDVRASDVSMTGRQYCDYIVGTLPDGTDYILADSRWMSLQALARDYKWVETTASPYALCESLNAIYLRQSLRQVLWLGVAAAAVIVVGLHVGYVMHHRRRVQPARLEDIDGTPVIHYDGQTLYPTNRDEVEIFADRFDDMTAQILVIWLILFAISMLVAGEALIAVRGMLHAW